MMSHEQLFRVYGSHECGRDGYPYVWHDIGTGIGVKDLVRQYAENRCVRCRHPYEPRGGEWTRCDSQCRHSGPVRENADVIEAQWRILTVHHLLLGDKAKRDLRWWNLVALCQRCHLTIQGKVIMEQVWPWEHSEWFKPYAAGWYAWSYLGQELSREEVGLRMEELLALERLSGVWETVGVGKWKQLSKLSIRF
jgi:hypothetical protein